MNEPHKWIKDPNHTPDRIIKARHICNKCKCVRYTNKHNHYNYTVNLIMFRSRPECISFKDNSKVID